MLGNATVLRTCVGFATFLDNKFEGANDVEVLVWILSRLVFRGEIRFFLYLL